MVEKEKKEKKKMVLKTKSLILATSSMVLESTFISGVMAVVNKQLEKTS